MPTIVTTAEIERPAAEVFAYATDTARVQRVAAERSEWAHRRPGRRHPITGRGRNLSTDKPAVLAEMFRVLVPGGRIGISDVVAEDHLTSEDRAAAGSHVGCIAGALSRSEYLDGLAAAGFADPSVTFTNQAAPGLHSAIVRAVKPAAR
jgi:hypothetical protein